MQKGEGHVPDRLVATACEAATAGIAVVDEAGAFRAVNAAFCALVARPREELLRRRFDEITHPDDVAENVAAFARLLSGSQQRYVTEKRYVRADGTSVWVALAAVPVPDRGRSPAAVVAHAIDVTGQRAARAALHRATHDDLTGLPSPALFLEQLAHALARLSRQRGGQVGVFCVGMDGLRGINDTHGHAVGDELLGAAAGRLQGLLRPADMLARVGGDEFTVLLEDLHRPEEAAVAAERLLPELGAPYLLSVGPLSAPASLGVATTGDPDLAPDTLIAHADSAMREAKQHGGQRVAVFDEADVGGQGHRRRVEVQLRDALDQDRLFLAYQPIVDLSDGRVSAVEALLRWQHPTRGLLTAGEFIGVAEGSGLMGRIGARVLRQACAQLADWDRELGDRAPDRMFLNVGARELGAGYPRQVAKILDDSGLEPPRLCLEVTETEILADPEAAHDAVTGLWELGCAIVIDDFGTGYSSLQRLTELPVAALKIDMSFVQSLTDRREAAAIVAAILLLAHNLRLDTVAEGIETAEQQIRLTDLGCRYGQGYRLGRPAPGADLTARLHENGGHRAPRPPA